MSRLFDDIVRSDPRPKLYRESSYEFLNRVRSRFWGRVRDELEAWFAGYPAGGRNDVSGRFRDRQQDQHLGGWWELYLHQLFQRLGYAVEVHPEVEGVSAHPDFLLHRDGLPVAYVEAAVFSSGIVEDGRHGERESWILAAIDQHQHPNFFVGVDFDHVGIDRPSVAEIATPVLRWLDTLDPDAVAQVVLAGGRVPELPVTPRDWKIRVRAYPIRIEARGRPSHRLVGVGPMSGGWVNDKEVLRRTLTSKARRYGDLAEPFVLATLPVSGTVDDESVFDALFGSSAFRVDVASSQTAHVRQPDGFWLQRRARKRRVSAVLFGSIQPHQVASTLPRLWINPWATRVIETAELSLPCARIAEDGRLVIDDGTRSAARCDGPSSGLAGSRSTV